MSSAITWAPSCQLTNSGTTNGTIRVTYGDKFKLQSKSTTTGTCPKTKPKRSRLHQAGIECKAMGPGAAVCARRHGLISEVGSATGKPVIDEGAGRIAGFIPANAVIGWGRIEGRKVFIDLSVRRMKTPYGEVKEPLLPDPTVVEKLRSFPINVHCMDSPPFDKPANREVGSTVKRFVLAAPSVPRLRRSQAMFMIEDRPLNAVLDDVRRASRIIWEESEDIHAGDD
ncbi:hypothetical protein BD779DRAFT_1477242 [Infundibulicybe gibba]|nr:hypothetical protein BD779DRAFT_1477242 [Infundibulicybe gibba]